MLYETQNLAFSLLGGCLQDLHFWTSGGTANNSFARAVKAFAIGQSSACSARFICKGAKMQNFPARV